MDKKAEGGEEGSGDLYKEEPNERLFEDMDAARDAWIDACDKGVERGFLYRDVKYIVQTKEYSQIPEEDLG